MDNAIDYVEEEIVRHEWTGNVDNITRGQLLVRCKDCIKLETNKCPMRERLFPNGDFYCADGVKRDA